MTIRTWLFNRLSTGPLPHTAHQRVFAKKSMTSSDEAYPFVVYKLGNATDEALAEDQDAGRQYLQIYVHDHADTQYGDYTQIDEVIRAIKDLLRNQSSAADDIITIQYLETSQDLDDQTLGTVMKYARFVVIYGKGQ